MINRTLTLLIGLIIVGTSHILSASDSKEATQKLTHAELLDKLRKKTGEKAQSRAPKHYPKSISKKDAELQNYAALDPQEAIFYANNPKLVDQVTLAHPELSRQSHRAGQGLDTLRQIIQIAMREHPDKVTRP